MDYLSLRPEGRWWTRPQEAFLAAYGAENISAQFTFLLAQAAAVLAIVAFVGGNGEVSPRTQASTHSTSVADRRGELDFVPRNRPARSPVAPTSGVQSSGSPPSPAARRPSPPRSASARSTARGKHRAPWVDRRAADKNGRWPAPTTAHSRLLVQPFIVARCPASAYRPGWAPQAEHPW
jgi:hypothetical protein